MPRRQPRNLGDDRDTLKKGIRDMEHGIPRLQLHDARGQSDSRDYGDSLTGTLAPFI